MSSGKKIFFVFFLLSCSLQSFSRPGTISENIILLKEKIDSARLQKNDQLILETYFGNHFSRLRIWVTSREDFQGAINFLQEGIAYAKSLNNIDFIALGQTQLAGVLRNSGDIEKALNSLKSAGENLERLIADSLKAVINIEFGDCYSWNSKIVEAEKYYTNAYSIALTIRNYALEKRVNSLLAKLNYEQNNDTSEAKKYEYLNAALARENKDGPGLTDAYVKIAQYTDNTTYVDTAYYIADSLKLSNKFLAAKSQYFYISGFSKNEKFRSINYALSYLHSNPDLKEFLVKSLGLSNYYFTIGQLYLENNLPDSALYYIKKVETDLLKDSTKPVLEWVNFCLARCYKDLNDIPNALKYYATSLDYNRQMGKLDKVSQISDTLSKLCGQISNFQLAYNYKQISDSARIAYASLANQKDLLYLNFEREERKQEEERRKEQERIHKKHNLQYLAIIISICIIFFGLALLGMFPVSKLAIKMSGFIAFICLFEFIILLIEHSVLHPITHGDPLQTWLLKIVLIAILVRAQEFVEHRIVHFLQSRKLHHMRTRLIAKKWWKRKRRPIPQPEIKEQTVNK